MKKFFAICAVALGLTGCANIDNAYNTLTGASVSPQSALVAANSFDALETVATGYLQLPACGSGAPVTCRNAAAVSKIVPAIRSGRAARNAIEALLSANNGGAITVASYNTLSAAVTTLEAVYSSYSISVTSAK